jgi:DNA-binding beta-propeller fold protein YncE
VNLPIANSVAVVDRKTGQTTATWKVTDARTNFAMALDEANHRVFSVFRNPSSIKVFDTESGRIVTTLPCVVDVDDIFYDANRKRIYLTGGEGFVDVFQQLDPDRYSLIGHIPTGLGARTSITWETRTRQGMTIAVPAVEPDGSGALLRAQFIDY